MSFRIIGLACVFAVSAQELSAQEHSAQAHAVEDLSRLGNDSGFRFERAEGAITVLEAGQPVLSYQRAVRDYQGKWPRSNYVYPLYDLDGRNLTEDFPEDHRHHRGIFWAWHQVLVGGKPVGDAWLCDNFQWQVKHVETGIQRSRAVLTTSTEWKSEDYLEDGKSVPFVREKMVLTVHPATEQRRILDFQLEFLALRDDVRIGGSDDEKGYGGFSPRIRLTDDLDFTGPLGRVNPTKLAIDAGEWIDISNQLGGVLMISHPQNPGQPQQWILRRGRSMQNARYPGRHPIQLSKTVPLRLWYRLVVHRGTLIQEDIDQLLLRSDSQRKTN